MPPRTEKIAQAVAREIVDEIVTSHMAPGTVLAPELAMANSFGISRQSLREALRVLEVLGLITIRTGPGGGPVTRFIDAKDFGAITSLYYQMTGTTFEEVVELRLALEPFTVGVAAKRRTSNDVAQLRRLIEAGAASKLDDHAFRRAGQDFHQAVATMTGNRALELLVHSCTEVFHGRVNTVLYAARQRASVISIHNEIAEAIIGQDAEKAERLMRKHMEDYKANLKSKFPHVMSSVVEW
jgi:GntR family transcriptional repressor for pyruvate dehydrogenase complex